MLQLPKEGRSLWQEAHPGPIFRAIHDDMEADVVVVGGGFTGLTTAYLLKQAGLKVVVLEKNAIGSGTSGQTTGKATSQHGLTYHDLQRRLGKGIARTYGAANQATIGLIERIVTQENIPCGWQREDNYVFTARTDRLDMFKQEAEAAKNLGLPAAFVTETPLPFAVKGAVKFADQAKIHCQDYLLGLARAIDGGGSHVFEDSQAVGIRDGSPGRVKTRRAAIVAKRIVVATNVPAFPLVARGGYCLLEYPTVSYGVAGRLEAGMDGMFISPDKDHFSTLPAMVDGAQRLIVVGAGGHLPGLVGNSEARYRRLADYAEQRFGVTELTHRWSAVDYHAYDYVPLIGKLYPWSRNLYVGTAFRKWGITGGTVAGIILSDLITGQSNDWASSFDSMRLKPILSIPRAAARYFSDG